MLNIKIDNKPVFVIKFDIQVMETKHLKHNLQDKTYFLSSLKLPCIMFSGVFTVIYTLKTPCNVCKSLCHSYTQLNEKQHVSVLVNELFNSKTCVNPQEKQSTMMSTLFFGPLHRVCLRLTWFVVAFMLKSALLQGTLIHCSWYGSC